MTETHSRSVQDWKDDYYRMCSIADAAESRATQAEAALLEARAREVALSDALRACAERFREYQKLHLAKSPPDIAKANANAWAARHAEVALENPSPAATELLREMERMRGALAEMIDAFKSSSDELMDYEKDAIRKARAALASPGVSAASKDESKEKK